MENQDEQSVNMELWIEFAIDVSIITLILK